MSRARKPDARWEGHQTVLLVSLHGLGFSHSEISVQIGKTVPQIKDKLKLLRRQGVRLHDKRSSHRASWLSDAAE